MKHLQISICAVTLLLALAGCARSPEARRDKFLANGKAALAKNDYQRAILEFKNAVRVMPRDAESYFQLGVASIGGGDIRTAVVAFRKVLDLNPKHMGAQLKLAEIMASSNEELWLKDAESRLKNLNETERTTEMLNTLALTELKLGKTEDAVQNLEESLGKAPQELTSAVLLANVKLSQKDTAGAESILKKACDAAPKAAEPRIVMGRFYIMQKQYERAEQEFQRAVAINPKSGAALMELASLQVSTGRKQDAETTFKRVASSGETQYRDVHALFLFEQGRHDESIREFEKLTKEDPEDRLTRTRLVSAYRAVNRTADAEKVLDQALKKNPKDLDALLQRAEISLGAGKYGPAEADLNQVIHLRPTSAEAYYIMAKLYQTRHISLSYRQYLYKALELNPYIVPIRLELAEALTAANEPKSALDVLNRAPESQRQMTAFVVQRNWAFWTLGDLPSMQRGIQAGLSHEKVPVLMLQDGLYKLRTGNVAGARAAIEEALKIDSSDIRALAALRQTYEAQKQPGIALQKIKEYASRQTNSAPVQEFLGLMLSANGERGGARTAFMAAKAADSNFTAADFSLVQLDAAEGKVSDAANRLKTVLAADGKNTTARLWLGNLEEVMGDHNAAIDEFRRVLDANPSDAQASNNLAYLLAEYRNQADEALKYAQKAVELAPDRPAYCDTLGWILYRKGVYGSAVTYLEKADSHGDNVVWKYHLAMAYTKAGERKRGRALLDAALKVNSKVPEAKIAQDVVSVSQ